MPVSNALSGWLRLAEFLMAMFHAGRDEAPGGLMKRMPTQVAAMASGMTTIITVRDCWSDRALTIYRRLRRALLVRLCGGRWSADGPGMRVGAVSWARAIGFLGGAAALRCGAALMTPGSPGRWSLARAAGTEWVLSVVPRS
jgi:hypothetical protein